MRRTGDEQDPEPERASAAQRDEPDSEVGPAARGSVKVAGRFVLEKLLGLGASGAVYRAYDEARGATIALKFLTALDPASVFRFKSEFRALANLVHPNLLQLYELLSHEDDWLLSMELVEGTDFLRFVRPLAPPANEGFSEEPTTALSLGTMQRAVDRPTVRPGRRRLPASVTEACAFDEARLRGALLQLCDGLQALHREGRLHRDLKPANVLIASSDERVVICDFGLVLTAAPRSLHSGERQDGRRFEVPREVAGTLPFMSPEQSQALELTPASDWYSVGVMLYQALTGRTPFGRASYDALLQAKLHREPAHPAQFEARVPAELAELALALLRPDPALRAGYAEAIAALRGDFRRPSRRARSEPSCVGRGPQLEQLAAAFAHARGRQPTLAFVSGLSGMGKSSLVHDFLARVEADADALVLRSRCYEREELPYKALDPLMDALSSHLLQLGDERAAALCTPDLSFLAALFPALKRVRAIAALPDGGTAVADLHERRRLAFRSFRALCERLSQRRPLVLFIDDLQWGDLDSAGLFAELLAPPSAPKLLIVCAQRSEDTARSPLLALLRALQAQTADALHAVDVTVGPLAEADAVALAESLLQGGVAHPAQAALLIAREAEGSPFFIRELAAHASEHGVALDASAASGASGLRLQSLIADKLAALSPDGRELLAAIAVAGRPVAHAIVRQATRLGAGTFKSLRELEAKRLVVSKRGSDGEDQVECHHDRIREAAHALLAGARAPALHRALAEALEQASEEDCDALFEHWRGAGERDKAGHYALRGAHKAETALAFRRAAELYREAIALLPAQDGRARELRERLGHALILAGRGTEAAAVFQGLIDGATPSAALGYRMLSTTQLLRCGRLVEGFAELQRGGDVFGVRFPGSEATALAMLLARRARIAFAERSIAWHDSDRAHAEAGRLEALWEVAAAVSNADMLRGSVYSSELMLRALALGDPSHIAGACGLESIVAAAAHKPQRAQRMFELADAAGRAAGQLHLLARVRGMQAIARQLQGRWLESIRLAREAQELQLRCARVNWDYTIVIWWEMASASMAGQLGALALQVPQVLREVIARGDVYAATEFRIHRCSWAWLALDRPEQVDREVDIAEREWTPGGYQFQHWHMTYARCEADLYRGLPPQRALERVEREWRRARLVHQVQGVRVDALYTRGRLALASAREQYRPPAIAQALGDARALIAEDAPWAIALGTLLLAGAASFSDRGEAQRWLVQAEALCNAADMPLHGAVARVRRGELLSGSQGANLIDTGLRRIRDLGAHRPEGFVRMLLPLRA